MTSIEPTASTTHPIGWSFIGAGAAFWLVPLFGLRAFLQSDHRDQALALIALVFFASLCGLILEFLLVPVERLLLRVSRLGKEDFLEKQSEVP